MNNDTKDEVVYLYLDDIIPNRFQPREVFDERALKELAVSIREHGVIQPIIVRNVNGKYEIIAGERRYKASALAGLTKIPAIIRNLDDKESSKVALLENLQRKNLSPIEEARTYQKILELDQMTQEELAKTMGKSQSSVANKLRLLSLPDEVQDALLKEQISERHARSLLTVPDINKQKELLDKIIKEKMTVKSLEEEIRNLYPKEDEDVSIANDLATNSPLTPTTDLSSNDDSYGKVTIVPPQEDNKEILNYGEIDNEDDSDDDSQLNIGTPISKANINEIKANSEEINRNTEVQEGGLDSLLNLENKNNNSDSGDTFKFITPIENLNNEVADKNVEENNNEYFQNLKTDKFGEILTNSESLSNNNENNKPIENYTMEEAQEKIRELVTDLKNHGIEVTIDEMNFEKTYQAIIKLIK